MSFIAAEMCQSSGSDVSGKQPRLSWPSLAYIFSTVYQVVLKCLKQRNDGFET